MAELCTPKGSYRCLPALVMCLMLVPAVTFKRVDFVFTRAKFYLYTKKYVVLYLPCVDGSKLPHKRFENPTPD